MSPESQGGLPCVSIVTPNYNYGRFVGETIRSILEQDYPRIECIVVDGGSTDNSLEVICAFGDAVKLIVAPGTSQTQAINLGLRASVGEIIGYVNLDDLFEDKESVRFVVQTLLDNHDALMVYGDAHEVDAQGRTLAYLRSSRDRFDLEDSFSRLHNPVPQPGSLMRRVALDLVGFFDERRQYMMDWDYWLHLATCGSLLHVPRCLSRQRVHGSAKTVRGLMLRVDDLRALYDDAFAGTWLPDHCRQQEQEIRFVVASYCAMLCFLAGEHTRGWAILKEALVHAQHSPKRELARLLAQSLQGRRGVTISRYLRMVNRSRK